MQHVSQLIHVSDMQQTQQSNPQHHESQFVLVNVWDKPVQSLLVTWPTFMLQAWDVSLDGLQKARSDFFEMFYTPERTQL